VNINREFTTYLLNLDNESFFAVYRNYLGPVETPYNKHDLIQDLQDFLTRPPTAERIRRLITDEEALVLSAVQVLQSPDEEQLYHFLASELDYAGFRTQILNLRDRLLLIDGSETGESTGSTVRINPLLSDALAPLDIGVGRLVAGLALERTKQNGIEGTPGVWLSPDFIVALYAFLREFSDLFTRTGSLRKKVVAALNERFGLSVESPGVLNFAISVCETLGLVHQDEDDQTITLRSDSWDSFGELPDRWIRALLWGAALTSSVERAFQYAELLLEALEAIPLDRSYSTGEVVRLLQLSGNGLSLPIDADTVQRLTYIGVVIPVDDPPSRFRLNPVVPTALSTPLFGDGVRIQANMDVTVPPGTPFLSAWTVARIAFLTHFDTVPTYVLSEESVSAARREGIEDPLSVLNSVVDSIPQNVRFLLKRWESRSRAVRMVQSLVVLARPEEAEILRASDEFTNLLTEEPAPGVFLFRSDDGGTVEKVLRKIDIGTDPMVETTKTVDVHVPEYDRFLLRHQQPALRASPRFSGHTPAPEASVSPNAGVPSAADIRRELTEALEGQSLPEDVRQEIALRIERGLILFPDQIRRDIIPQYGIEVRGLDYLGKIRLCEQAISNGDVLEVITRSGSGSPQRIMVRPREVVESGGDLMLRAVQEPEGRAIKIRIRRISVLRRLSGTLINRND